MWAEFEDALDSGPWITQSIKREIRKRDFIKSLKNQDNKDGKAFFSSKHGVKRKIKTAPISLAWIGNQARNVKRKREHGQPMEQVIQEACFARATQVWLAVNHNTSVTSEQMEQGKK